MSKDAFDAIDHHLDRFYPPENKQATVATVAVGSARVLIDGTSNLQPAVVPNGVTVNSGDRVSVQRMTRTAQWSILVSYGSVQNANPVPTGLTGTGTIGSPTPVSLPPLSPNPSGSYSRASIQVDN